MATVPAWTKTKADGLGARLRRSSEPSAADTASYEDYRRTFVAALTEVLIAMRAVYHPVARLKTLESVVAKLKRQLVRLSQMQDIAGCRVVVADIGHQDRAVSDLRSRLECAVTDHREIPQCGYRAVHVVVKASTDRPVEVQVRTAIQDVWANVSEALAAQFGPDIKYCGGPGHVRDMLDGLSTQGQQLERMQREANEVMAKLDALRSSADTANDAQDAMLPELDAEVEALLSEIERTVEDYLNKVASIGKLKP